MIKIALVFVLFLTTHLKVVLASSCCGSGQATSGLILSEQKLLLNTSLSQASSVGRIYDSKEFFVFDGSKQRINNRLSLSASYALNDRNQIGFSSSVLFSNYKDQFGDQSEESFGDANLSFSRKYKGKGFDYFLNLGLILPTGQSPHEGRVLSENANVSGFGQSGTLVGITLHKVQYPYTFLVEARYSRYFKGQVESIDLEGFNLFNASFFAGYSLNFWDVSFGGGVSLNSLESRRFNGIKTGVSRFPSVNFVISKSLDEKSSLALNYSDQTLIGGAKNSLLDRVIGLNFIYSIF